MEKQNCNRSKMHDSTRQRLMKTERGQALIKVIDATGGTMSLSRILGVERATINGWICRNEIPMLGAHMIGNNEFFSSRGITRDDARPGVSESEWIAADGPKLNPKPRKNLDSRRKALKKTPEGAALVSLLEEAGGPTALSEALEVDIERVYNWINRKKVSKEGAVIIGKCKHFKVTSEQMRPDLTKFQWMDKR